MTRTHGPLTTALAALLLAVLAVGCGQEDGASAAGGDVGNDTGGVVADAQAADSAGADAKATDATVVSDATPTDAATDAATPVDAAVKDGAVKDGTTPDAATPDTTSDVGTSDAGPPPKAWFACTKDEQCRVFETKCCDHCNGGKQLAVHQDHFKAAKAALATPAEACKSVACTEMACAPSVGVCEVGQCVAKPDSTWGKACKDLGESDCKKSTSCGPIYAHDTANACADTGTSVKTFAGCMSNSVGCGDALTCGSNGGKLAVFMSTCLPAGWKAEKYDTCCKPSSTKCIKGSAATLTKLCVRPVGGGLKLEIGKPVEMVVYPKGCMSSSCTKIHSSACSVKPAGKGFAVSGLICLEGTGGIGPCTADCNGGGYATCATGALAAGSYVATLGNESVSFKVPAPVTGLCAGKQW